MTTMSKQGQLLLGAIRRNFELLVELDKTAPGEVNEILAAMVKHIRSYRPQVLLAAQVPEVDRAG